MRKLGEQLPQAPADAGSGARARPAPPGLGCGAAAGAVAELTAGATGPPPRLAPQPGSAADCASSGLVSLGTSGSSSEETQVAGTAPARACDDDLGRVRHRVSTQ